MKSFIALVVLLALFASGEARKCNKCFSLGNSTCGDPFKESKEVEKATYVDESCACMKTVLELTNGTSFVERGCLKPEYDTSILSLFAKTDKNFKSVKSYSQHFCTDKDLCNGASSFTGVLFTAMGAAMTLLVVKWY